MLFALEVALTEENTSQTPTQRGTAHAEMMVPLYCESRAIEDPLF